MPDLFVVELFPCSGGMAEGLRRAGIPISMAFDKDPNAIASYEANLHHRPVHMDVNDLHRMVSAGWRPERPVDLLVADPPCTPWSRAGKRKGRSDERDMLDVTVDLVRMLRPRAYLIANVPGLDEAPNWPIVQQTIGRLTRAGYCANDFARLDAADFGVPQHRVRPFWYGHLTGPCVEWPNRTHGSPKECAHPTLFAGHALEPYVTCRQALGHLTGKDLGAHGRLRWRGQNGKQQGSVPDAPARVVGTTNLSDGNVLTHPEASGPKDRRAHRHPGKSARASRIDEPAGVVTANEQGDGNMLALTAGPNHRVSVLDEPARTLTRNTHSDGAMIAMPPEIAASTDMFAPSTMDEPSRTIRSAARGQQLLEVPDLIEVPHHPPSEADEPSRAVRASSSTTPDKIVRMSWPWERPATTIQRDDRLPPPGHHDENWDGGTRSHPNAIKLSEKAAAILQGFPEAWVFAGKTKEARWSQIGQAMPPALAHAVGSRILVALRALLARAS